ncbi:polyphosphate kinase 2, partial [Pseudonocardia sp. RS11V-5]|nr:polyphosphate kinase 2 [Pseudonocardia terrae]
SRARDDMFAATDTAWAPWCVAHSDDKKRARLNIITHLLGRVPYEHVHRKKVRLPRRELPANPMKPSSALRYIPTPF